MNRKFLRFTLCVFILYIRSYLSHWHSVFLYIYNILFIFIILFYTMNLLTHSSNPCFQFSFSLYYIYARKLNFNLMENKRCGRTSPAGRLTTWMFCVFRAWEQGRLIFFLFFSFFLGSTLGCECWGGKAYSRRNCAHVDPDPRARILKCWVVCVKFLMLI